MPTALLIDGDFFLKRYRYLRGNNPPDKVASDLQWLCYEHLKPRQRQRSSDNKRSRKRSLYRIFFYDCPPSSKRVHNPVTGKHIDFSQTPTARWRLAFHEELKKLRKVALRLGHLNERYGQWRLRPDKFKELIANKIAVKDLQEEDLVYDVSQKGVDMRIGLDIASLAFKKQVDQIILVSGDSDFVPAAKLARREGIDFILDPMWATIRADLNEHIDGLRCVFGRNDDGAQERGSRSETEPKL